MNIRAEHEVWFAAGLLVLAITMGAALGMRAAALGNTPPTPANVVAFAAW